MVVKTKNKYYAMRAALSQLRFNDIQFIRNPVDDAESKVYMSKKLGPETLHEHQTQRSVAEVI
jgi:hypothetical protein